MRITLTVFVTTILMAVISACSSGSDSNGGSSTSASILNNTRVLNHDTFVSNWINDVRNDDGIETWFSFLIEVDEGLDALDEVTESLELIMNGGSDRRTIPFDTVRILPENEEETIFQMSFWVLADEHPDRFFVNENTLVLTDFSGNELRHDFSLTLSDSVSSIDPQFIYRDEYQGDDKQFGIPAMGFITISNVNIDISTDTISLTLEYSDDRISRAVIWFVSEEEEDTFTDVLRARLDLAELGLQSGHAHTLTYSMSDEDIVDIIDDTISPDEASRLVIIGLNETVPFFDNFYGYQASWMRSAIYFQLIESE